MPRYTSNHMPNYMLTPDEAIARQSRQGRYAAPRRVDISRCQTLELEPRRTTLTLETLRAGAGSMPSIPITSSVCRSSSRSRTTARSRSPSSLMTSSRYRSGSPPRSSRGYRSSSLSRTTRRGRSPSPPRRTTSYRTSSQTRTTRRDRSPPRHSTTCISSSLSRTASHRSSARESTRSNTTGVPSTPGLSRGTREMYRALGSRRI